MSNSTKTTHISHHQNMLIVEYIQNDRYGLYWADEDGNNQVYIATVFGFNNAVRVGNGLAHEQVEYVRTPPFMSEYEREQDESEADKAAEANRQEWLREKAEDEAKESPEYYKANQPVNTLGELI